MSYVLLCAGFLLAAGAIALVVRRRDRMPSAASLLVAVAALLLLTAVFDNLMIAVGLFARRGADVCLLGTGEGVKTLTF